MYPILFTIGSFQVYSWGVVFAVTILVSLWAIGRLARFRGISEDRLQESLILLVLFGLLGARSLSVILNWSSYAEGGFRAVVDLRSGGLAFHGGLVAGIAALPFLSRRSGIPAIRFADILAPVLSLGYGIQRFGCLLNGDSFGIPTNGSWGVTTPFAPGPRHPVQLYDALMNIALFTVLLKVYNKKPKDGTVAALYLGGSALARFTSEFFRAGEKLFLTFSAAQLASLTLMVVAVLTLVLLIKRAR